MSAEKRIPLREEVALGDTWDLTHLYKSDEEWESDLKRVEGLIDEVVKFRGTLKESPSNFLALLKLIDQVGILIESISQYSFLLHAGDGSNSQNQRRQGLAMQLYTNFSSQTSFLNPEILSIDTEVINSWLEREEFKDYRVMVEKMLRYKPHVLTADEEKILALQGEVGRKSQDAFNTLTNVDFDFGSIITPEGKIPLTQSTFGYLLQSKDRKIRERAYRKFYGVFDKHKHTLAVLYEASVKQDIFGTKVRSYEDSRSKALFPDKVDVAVYDNLVSEVHNALPSLHRYYELRRRLLGVNKLAHYDVYVPLVGDIEVKHTYEEAVDVIVNAMAPLGEEYVSTIGKGLTTDRWVDRYENRGKRSGAFSSGTFSGPPYILMNYKEDVLRDVFTLAHEGGHSMHSYYSSANNPFSSYDYTIFEAEVASTFNEQLLADYMIKEAKEKELVAYILGKQIDDVVATLYRQTMFAEFEHLCHVKAEGGEPLTLDLLRSTYRGLLEQYFGPEVTLLKVSDLEGLRIPHFYRAFYVYKYATGISAAITLSEKVLNGGVKERDDYLNFLKSGGSRYPIEALKLAGVDMESPEPIKKALDTFSTLLDRFEALL
ncbi:MAG: oligoendopeptidase F [Sphaerochaetaceae bacterium]|jgi:oligoendopeptidase F|nr:oligoendopeptidase F [Sphaerochaetaceae bacterium]HHU88286.1 oligoendopeptidase F [Spirochaetales bacterium]